MKSMTILYVSDQNQSKDFYRNILDMEPGLHVPGMTEFHLSDSHILGLMPNEGIDRLLGGTMPSAAAACGIPRCEIYLMVDKVEECFERAVSCGAKILSNPAERNWGHFVAYTADPDGHILAFAKQL